MWLKAWYGELQRINANRIYHIVHVVVHEAQIVEHVDLLILGQLVGVIKTIQDFKRARIVFGINCLLRLRNRIVDRFADCLSLLGLLSAALLLTFLLRDRASGHEKGAHYGNANFQ